jgi:hypothetical protein
VADAHVQATRLKAFALVFRAGFQHPVTRTGVASKDGDAAGAASPFGETGAVTVSIIVSMALAASQGPVLPQSGPAAFDVAGVRLGMTPDQVRLALLKAGYRLGSSLMLESFKGEVAARVAEIRHQYGPSANDTVAGIDAQGPSAERIGVEFKQWPDGPHAVRIAFMGNAQRQTQDAFKAQVESKYGKPTMRGPTNWRWCGPDEKQCASFSDPSGPALTADYQMRALTVTIGGEALQARKALVDAEARKIAPLQNGSAF